MSIQFNGTHYTGCARTCNGMVYAAGATRAEVVATLFNLIEGSTCA